MDVLSTELISSDESRKFHEELVETFDGWRDGILSAGPQASAVKKTISSIHRAMFPAGFAHPSKRSC